ncbi:Phosphate ABC transporter, permease protein PstC [Syntrophomonas zehnderi OL-4]|uniref:Phosphate transport system permease protein n=1 Tax=Syntrophomonas zehnderi OL-4 TaxID=690567 RepID=A0A0E4GBQ6_9FIRM|nr:phosphate ABC transporter permease subunit PstC [Syntrophomonas zehnderi]CFX54704.1 Phosphate ABC transporter, permease protein PstC [Syntrophomonas zehnderi OL-4]
MELITKPGLSNCEKKNRSLIVAENRHRRVDVEKLIEKTLLLSAAVFVLIIALITIFIFAKGLPLFSKIGLGDFLFSNQWNPTKGFFGIGTMFIGTLLVTMGAMLWSVPIGLSSAIFMAEIAPPRIGKTLGQLVNLLAGIPSVVYGFVGLIVIVPFIRESFGGNGMSLLAGAIILGIMILPTIINISRDSLLAVPNDYKSSSLALGATHFQTIRYVIVPAARSGIITSVVLGMGRAIGETMAVVMVTGNSAMIPTSILAPIRTMTSNIVLEMGYASGDHQTALFATGMVLFLLIVGLNLIINRLAKAGTDDGRG